MTSLVAIVRGKDIENLVNKAISLAGGLPVKKGDKVLIKPNLCIPKKGAATNPLVVEALIKLLLKIKAKPAIGEGALVGYDTGECFKKLGYVELSKKYKIPLIDFNKQSKYMLKEGKHLKKIRIPEVLSSFDKIISVPVMKTHVLTTVTLSIKNMKGIVPGIMKWKSHMHDLDKSIVDIYNCAKPDFVVIDGTYAMEGRGPTAGNVFEFNTIVAGKNAVAADYVCSKLMGFDPRRIRHIMLASKGIKDIKIKGLELSSAMRKFKKPVAGESILLKLIRLLQMRSIFTNKLKPKPKINHKRCIKCKKCIAACPAKAIKIVNDKITVQNNCIRCGICEEACPHGAIKFKKI